MPSCVQLSIFLTDREIDRQRTAGRGRIEWLWVESSRVGSGLVGSGGLGSCRVGSDRVGSGRAGPERFITNLDHIVRKKPRDVALFEIPYDCKKKLSTARLPCVAENKILKHQCHIYFIRFRLYTIVALFDSHID